MANILLLERRAQARDFLTAQIAAEGNWHVFSANSTDEAISLLRSGPIDIVVANLGAMGASGRDLIEAAAPVPVVVTSEPDRLEGLIEALEAGAANYIPRHLIEDRLVGAIHRALSSARRTSNRTRLLGSMRFSHSRFSIPTDLSMLSVVADRLQASLEMFGLCDGHQTIQVRIALDEALANAFYHGNLEVSSDLKEDGPGDFEELTQQRLTERPYCDRRIEIEEHLTREEARFVIRDEGPGFDINAVPDPTDSDRLTRCSGRGIAMMRHFLDQVIFNDKGNEVTLVKRCSPVPAASVTSDDLGHADDAPNSSPARSTSRREHCHCG